MSLEWRYSFSKTYLYILHFRAQNVTPMNLIRALYRYARSLAAIPKASKSLFSFPSPAIPSLTIRYERLHSHHSAMSTIPRTMKALIIERKGVAAIENVPVPTISPTEVLVKVEYAAAVSIKALE